MTQTVTIIGLEKVGYMGRYVRCDQCDDPAQDFTLGLSWPSDDRTVQAAKEAGWSVTDGRHVCPKCTNGGY